MTHGRTLPPDPKAVHVLIYPSGWRRQRGKRKAARGWREGWRWVVYRQPAPGCNVVLARSDSIFDRRQEAAADANDYLNEHGLI